MENTMSYLAVIIVPLIALIPALIPAVITAFHSAADWRRRTAPSRVPARASHTA
jgi:hypothetical protein